MVRAAAAVTRPIADDPAVANAEVGVHRRVARAVGDAPPADDQVERRALPAERGKHRRDEERGSE